MKNLYIKKENGEFERLLSLGEQAGRLGVRENTLYTRLRRNPDLLKRFIHVAAGFYQLESTFTEAEKNQKMY